MTHESTPKRSTGAGNTVKEHRPGEKAGVPILKILERYALAILTVGVFVTFSVLPASRTVFPTINNLNVVLGSQAVVAMLALGVLLPLICGYFDFSLGAIAVLSQVLAAGLMANAGWPVLTAVTLSILVAGLVGALNGFLVTRLKMNSFVTTLGMAMALTGVCLWYTGGQSISSGIDASIIKFGSARLLGLPVVVYIVLLVAVAVWYLFSHTAFGRSMYAIGSNASSARLVGIRVDRQVWWSFTMGALIAGGAGVLQLSRVGSATAGSGNELLFPALAAVFLGATAIRPGFFNVFGTLIGAIFVSVAVSGLTLSGASGWAASLFNGLALLVAVALSTYLGRRQSGLV